MSARTQTSLAIIFVLIAVVCVGLGLWQVDRLRGRRAANAVAAAKRSRPAVALDSGGYPDDTALAQRRVIAVGRYDYDREIILRGQAMDGVPGVHIVTPLVLTGTDTAVLVNRGFMPSPDALTVPRLGSPREPGVVRVEGLALPIERSGRGHPITHSGRTSWARLDLGALTDSLPYTLLGVYLRRAAASGDAPIPHALPLPPLDDGPHLSYALQWFSFAMVALIFAGVVWRKRI